MDSSLLYMPGHPILLLLWVDELCYQNIWVRHWWSELINVKVSFRSHLQMHHPFLGVFI